MGLTAAELLNPAVWIDATRLVGAKNNFVVTPTDVSGNAVSLTLAGSAPVWLADAGDGVPAFRFRNGALIYDTANTPRTIIAMIYQGKGQIGVRTIVAGRSVSGSSYGRSCRFATGQANVQLETYTDPPATLTGRLASQLLSAEDGPFLNGWITRAMTTTSPGSNQHQLRAFMAGVDASFRNGAGSYETRNNWGTLTATDRIAIGGDYDSGRTLSYTMRNVLVRVALVYDVALTPAQIREVTTKLEEAYRPQSLRLDFGITFTTGYEEPAIVTSSGDDFFTRAVGVTHSSIAAGVARSVRDPSGLFVGNDYIVAKSSPVLNSFNQEANAFPIGTTPPISYVHSVVSAIPVSSLATDNIAMTQRSVIDWTTATPIPGYQVTDAWAPELHQVGADIYCITSLRWYTPDGVSNITFQPYVTLAANPELSAWGSITKLAGTAFAGRKLIDTIIVAKDGGGFRCFVKDDDEQKTYYTDASTFLGPYNTALTYVSALDLTEGLCAVRLGANLFRLYADDYNGSRSAGKGYYYFQSGNNLATYAAAVRPEQALPLRHGNFDRIPMSVAGDVTSATIDATGTQVTVNFSRDLATAFPARAKGIIVYVRETLTSGLVRDTPYKVARIVRTGARVAVAYLARRVPSTAVAYVAYQNGNLAYSDNSAVVEFSGVAIGQGSNTTTLIQSDINTSPLTLLVSDTFTGADIAFGAAITNFGSSAAWRRLGNRLVSNEAQINLTRSDVTATNPVIEVDFDPSAWDLGTIPSLAVLSGGRFSAGLNTYGGINGVSVIAGVVNETTDAGPAVALSVDGRLYRLRLTISERSTGTMCIGELIDTTDGAVLSYAQFEDTWGGRPTGAKSVAIRDTGGPNTICATNVDNLKVYERTLYAAVPSAPTGVIPAEGDGVIVTITDSDSGDVSVPRIGGEGWVITEAGTPVAFGVPIALEPKKIWLPRKTGTFGAGATTLGSYTQGSVGDNSDPGNLLANVTSFAVTNNSTGAGGGGTTVADPAFIPLTGAVVAPGGFITCTTATPSSVVRYTFTTDGSTPADPTEGSPQYPSVGVPIDAIVKIKARAFRPGFTSSGIVSGTWTEGVTPSPTYNVSVSPASATVLRGGTRNFIVTVVRTNGHVASLTPSVTDLPDGVTGAWSPTSGTGNTFTLTLTAEGDAALGSDAFTINFTDGTIARSLPATVIVADGVAVDGFTAEDRELLNQIAQAVGVVAGGCGSGWSRF